MALQSVTRPTSKITIPFKWKLAASIFGLAFGLVSISLLIAKDAFENDKVPSLFAARETELEALSRPIAQRLEASIQNAQTFLLSFDVASKKLSPLAQSLFNADRNLLALSVTDLDDNKMLIEISKNPQLNKQIESAQALAPHTNLFWTAIDQSRFLVEAKEGTGSRTLIRTIVEIPEVFSNPDPHATYMLLDGSIIVSQSHQLNLPVSLIRELSGDRFEKTMKREIGAETYLISSVSIPNSNMRLVAIDSEKYALSAMYAIYRRAALLLGLATFLTLLIAFGISTGLTRKLNSLTLIAGKIGQGDFSHKTLTTSNDEVGILQSAFSRMSDEIQKLIRATAENTRMEEELKTTRLVQERLFPKEADFTSGSIRLSGRYDTSTECGGDWWYYFERGENILIAVADATGHGTPAALSTAASRAIFSYIEKNQSLSLEEMAASWDDAIANSAGQKVFMTGLLILLNKKSGDGHFLSASHEPPILVRVGNDCDFVPTEGSSPLGERKGNWKVMPFNLAKGERALLYTDGLWAVENIEKKTLSEARFIKKLSKLAASTSGARGLLDAVYDTLQDHRQGEPYPDDLTLVVIEHLNT